MSRQGLYHTSHSMGEHVWNFQDIVQNKVDQTKALPMRSNWADPLVWFFSECVHSDGSHLALISSGVLINVPPPNQFSHYWLWPQQLQLVQWHSYSLFGPCHSSSWRLNGLSISTHHWAWWWYCGAARHIVCMMVIAPTCVWCMIRHSLFNTSCSKGIHV